FLTICGVGAVLVGESLVKQADIASAVQTLIGQR
ncbi:MAG: indole-3-glycerol-phosphate synthase TrpC, partial [Pseudanabaena sp. RU_4_16]|nr:indole-3-glycerol-phosphate synthase TrpC [Pseudanabaena sp. RU_4_16]